MTDGLVLHWARAYDGLVWVMTLGKEGRFREDIVGLAGLAAGESVLDVGCGTGALALAAKRATGPEGRVCGVDPSPEMVARAGRKAAKAGLDITFQVGEVERLPFPEHSFDVVCSTLMLHHLSEGGRAAGIAEIARVLKPGGRYLAVDIGAKGHRHGLLLRINRHAAFDLDATAPQIESAGLRVADRGPVESPLLGMSNLRYLVARVA